MGRRLGAAKLWVTSWGFLHHNCCFHHIIFSLLRVYAYVCGFEAGSIVVNVDD